VVQWPVGILLPVLGILSVTSEWSQRTALTTFTLVPNRFRVIGAKIAAVAVLAVASLVIAFVVGAVANLVAGGAWDFGAMTVLQALVFQLAASSAAWPSGCCSRPPRPRSSPTTSCRRS
jgi:ABC-type transport system involved in multi-copper enzyme maturation permease subunit